MSLSPPRTVLVTGSAKRLGCEIALALAAGGWRVAVHYRDSQEDAIATVNACSKLMAGASAFKADLANENDVRNLPHRVLTQFGRLDAIVNNAALFEYDEPSRFGYAALEAHVRINAGAAVLLAQALHEHVCQRDGTGAVVNLLDQKLWNQNPDFFSYSMSKAALEAANTMLSMALAPRVRVVGVAPGLTLTSHMLSPQKFAQMHKLSPLGQSSSAADVAATVKFALETHSITGTTLLVDGGQHLMKFDRDFSLM